MATTFTKSINHVIIIIGDESYSMPCNSAIVPDPRNENIIVIQSEICPQNEYEGLRVDITDVTGIEFTDRGDLIEILSGSSYFTESLTATIEGLTGFATEARQITGNNLLTDLKGFFTGVYDQLTHWFAVKVLNFPEDYAKSATQTDGSQKTLIVDLDGHVPNIQSVNTPFAGDEYCMVTQSIIHGKTTGGGGGWVDVKVNPSGALTTESTITNDVAINGAAITGQSIETGGSGVLGWLSSIRVKAAAVITALTDGSQKTQIANGTDTAAIVTGANTGVKGLRVYTGPTDPISDIPVTIAYDHHQIHEGEMYKYVWQGALNGATKDFRISVPNLSATTRTPHFVFEIVGNNTTINATLYEGTTFTTVGTDDSANIFNRNRNSLNVAGTKIYVSGATALTPNVLGSILDQNFMFPGKPASNYDRNMAEWDLKASTEYLLRVVTTGNGIAQVKLHWYEDLGI